MWHYGITQSATFWWCGVVHSTWPSRAMWHMHAPTFNKWHKKNKNKNKNKKVTLHILTHSAMWGCGLTSLVVCINDKIHHIRERKMTIRREVWTTNIRSLRFWDIREWVTLWKLTFWSLRCIHDSPPFHSKDLFMADEYWYAWAKLCIWIHTKPKYIQCYELNIISTQQYDFRRPQSRARVL
jgi:hypothetical protein